MMQDTEASPVGGFVRVAHQLIVEIAREVSHEGHGDTYHRQCF